MIAYFAGLLVVVVIVPLDVNSREDFLGCIAETSEAKYLITTQKQYSSFKQALLSLIDIESLPEEKIEPELLPTIDESDMAELVFASGTTGQSKGVMISQGNIASNALAALTELYDLARERFSAHTYIKSQEARGHGSSAKDTTGEEKKLICSI